MLGQEALVGRRTVEPPWLVGAVARFLKSAMRGDRVVARKPSGDQQNILALKKA